MGRRQVPKPVHVLARGRQVPQAGGGAIWQAKWSGQVYSGRSPRKEAFRRSHRKIWYLKRFAFEQESAPVGAMGLQAAVSEAVAWARPWPPSVAGGRRCHMAGHLFGQVDPGRSRLPKGHRAVRKRFWDEAAQRLVLAETRKEVPWQTLTQNRILWDSLELRLVVCRVGRDHPSVCTQGVG